MGAWHLGCEWTCVVGMEGRQQRRSVQLDDARVATLASADDGSSVEGGGVAVFGRVSPSGEILRGNTGNTPLPNAKKSLKHAEVWYLSCSWSTSNGTCAAPSVSSVRCEEEERVGGYACRGLRRPQEPEREPCLPDRPAYVMSSVTFFFVICRIFCCCCCG